METPLEQTCERPADLINPCQAAKLVGVHLATIYRWMDDGTLPFWVIGKRQRRLSRRDVAKMVRAGKTKIGTVVPSQFTIDLKNRANLETLREFKVIR